jgi:PhzF family phenazine biosynthesis protein
VPRYRLFQVDAFTSVPWAGNPAGVVPRAEGLSDRQMQAIARELNNSETVFLFPPRGPDHDVWVRFFTPNVEVPLCGHATLAAHAVRSRLRGEEAGQARQGAPGGVWRVRWEGSRVAMLQEPIWRDAETSGEERARILAALGLKPEEVADLPIDVMSNGRPKFIVPVRSEEILRGLRPDSNALVELSRELGPDGYLAFAPSDRGPGGEPGRGGLRFAARVFVPAAGIPEDPFNGSGQGPLGAYLVRHGAVAAPAGDGVVAYTVEMGHAQGRPGEASVELRLEDGAVARAWVGGDTALVFETEIEAPPA